MNDMRDKMQEVIDLLNEIDNYIRVNNLENEHFFIEWQDKVNEISVR